MTAPTELQELRTLLAEISDLRGIEALLYWDQATYLPPKAGDGRSSQLASQKRRRDAGMRVLRIHHQPAPSEASSAAGAGGDPSDDQLPHSGAVYLY